jgi:hypothetical protein
MMSDELELKQGIVKMLAAMVAGEMRVILVCLAAIGLWTWAVYLPDPFRIMAATGFSLFIFLPVMLLDKRRVS